MKAVVVREQDPRADYAMRRWNELRQERTQFENDWEDTARLIRPQRGQFRGGEVGDRRLEKPLASEPIIANLNFGANIYGTLTNPANRWFSLAFPDQDLMRNHSVSVWLHNTTSRILASFRPSVSPFYTSAIQLFSDISAMGNACQYDEMLTAERKIMDVTVSIGDVVWDIDAFGRVREVIRKFRITGMSAMELFAGRGGLPEAIVTAAGKTSADKFTFYQHVERNTDFVPHRLGVRGKPWISRYVCEEKRCLISERGYDDMPFDVARWEVDTGMSCGVGPGYIALASARTLHHMEGSTIRAAQHAANPTVLAPDRDVIPLNGRIIPGSVLYGGVDARGNPLIRTFQPQGNISLTLEEKQSKIGAINDAFYGQLMSLANRTGVTDLEAMELQEERARLMSPNLGRVQYEYLAPKIERRFAMLWKAGQISTPPEIAREQPLEVQYRSAAAMAERSSQGASTIRLLNDITPLAQARPEVMDRIDTDGAVEVLAEARGVPPGVLVSRERAAEIREQRAEAQRAAQQAQLLQTGGAGARDLAQAAAALQGGAEGGQQ